MQVLTEYTWGGIWHSAFQCSPTCCWCCPANYPLQSKAPRSFLTECYHYRWYWVSISCVMGMMLQYMCCLINSFNISTEMIFNISTERILLILTTCHMYWNQRSWLSITGRKSCQGQGWDLNLDDLALLFICLMKTLYCTPSNLAFEKP